MTDIYTGPRSFAPASQLTEAECRVIHEKDELEAWAISYEMMADLIRSGTITLGVLKEWEVREQVLSEGLARYFSWCAMIESQTSEKLK